MKDIDKRLEKYFEGETSLKEEQLLRDYFSKGDVAEQHKAYAPMFGFFEQARNKEKSNIKPQKRRLPLYIWSGIAASIMLIAVLKLTLTYQKENTSMSLVYIDGQRISDVHTINSHALTSIENISDLDKDAISSQIAILDSFTE